MAVRVKTWNKSDAINSDSVFVDILTTSYLTNILMCGGKEWNVLQSEWPERVLRDVRFGSAAEKTRRPPRQTRPWDCPPEDFASFAVQGNNWIRVWL